MKVKKKCQVFKNAKEIRKEMSGKKKAFRAGNINSELKEKGHELSRAELKIPQLELWLEPAWLRLITNKNDKNI